MFSDDGSSVEAVEVVGCWMMSAFLLLAVVRLNSNNN